MRQCLADIHSAMQAGNEIEARPLIQKADEFFTQKKQRIAETRSLALLDGMMPPMWTYKDDTLRLLEALTKPVPPTPPVSPSDPPKRLMSEADINAYVEQMRSQLLAYMKGSDGIDLK